MCIRDRENIRKWRKEKKETQQTAAPRRSLYYQLAAAASVAALIGFFTFAILPNQYTNEAIQTAYYQEDLDLLSGVRSDDPADVLQQGLANYEAKQYDQAIQQLQQFSDNDKAIYALAHSFYATQQYDQASTAFQKVIERGNPQYIQKAEWYLLLSYIGNNDLGNDFTNLLEKVINQKGTYSSKAQQIQEDLNSFWRR